MCSAPCARHSQRLQVGGEALRVANAGSAGHESDAYVVGTNINEVPKYSVLAALLSSFFRYSLILCCCFFFLSLSNMYVQAKDK